jgi:hypothetical protein
MAPQESSFNLDLVHHGPHKTPHRKRIIKSAQLPKYLGLPLIDQLTIALITSLVCSRNEEFDLFISKNVYMQNKTKQKYVRYGGWGPGSSPAGWNNDSTVCQFLDTTHLLVSTRYRTWKTLTEHSYWLIHVHFSPGYGVDFCSNHKDRWIGVAMEFHQCYCC